MNLNNCYLFSEISYLEIAFAARHTFQKKNNNKIQRHVVKFVREINKHIYVPGISAEFSFLE